MLFSLRAAHRICAIRAKSTPNPQLFHKTAMVNLMRRYRQTLMLIVTVIIIISFGWFFTDYRLSSHGHENAVGVIYDRPVRLAEFERGLRRMQLLSGLGMEQLVRALTANARSEQEAQANFVFNTYVLRHEADALGFVPTDAEVVEETKKMPIFQKNGAFDPSLYTQVGQNIGRLGFDDSNIEEAVRDSLRFQKLNKLFSSTIGASPASARDMFERRNQKTEVGLVRINREEIAKTIQITDEDLKKAFEERKDTLKTDEMRKIRYVPFVLSEEDKKLPGPQRGEAFQKLLDKASEFTVAMTAKDAKFEDVAKKFGVEVKETPDFPQTKPPAELGQSREVAAAVFNKLTMEQPNSDAIGTPNGYYAVQLTGVTPSRPLTFDEAKEQLTETIKNDRTSETLDLKGRELRAKLETDLKAGKTFAEAAQAAGVTVESLPAFSFMERLKPEVKDGEEVMNASAEMTVGQLSEVLSTATGSIIFRIEKRHPIDEAAFEKEKPELMERLADFQAMNAFSIWLAERRKAANLQTKIGG
jgi:peptidyl-prolyl cis-trans isomerase D